LLTFSTSFSLTSTLTKRHYDGKTKNAQGRIQYHAVGKRRQRRCSHARPVGLNLHEKGSEVLRLDRFRQLDNEDIVGIVGIDGLACVVERLTELGNRVQKTYT